MVVLQQNQFSPKGLRLFYLYLIVLTTVALMLSLYGWSLSRTKGDEAAIFTRALMLHSWWMVASGIITFSGAYMIAALLPAMGQDHDEPVKPARKVVLALAILFASVHSLRLAYGGNLPSDLIIIFVKDLLGVVAALALTSVRSLGRMLYR